ncbi:MAG: acyl-CoA dehydrogenase [Deltaproteobacteria bacterium RIFCSPLOWO2_12_FULL_50_11]|nr:MAG: acyl-CoA dehydrogenase [Deltaproteobacteria bacterium RIFCSPHIGHO2_02_FULL_50_15]OGQ67471.1 MAG: acyl-CoA dehydrogenase [Deltaproteobacteria bacterium RIFCSPLOWO2_12_FULL_50_11]
METVKDVDFLDLNSLLGDEERLLRDSVRHFVQENVLPIIDEHYERATFPQHLISEMGRLGYLGANLKGYGCAGLSPLAYGLLNQELEAGDAGLRSFVSVQGSLVMYAIHAFGSEDQRRKWLPLLARGEKVGCFGLTEPDFGSNPMGMRTRATVTQKGYLLQGSKMWITNGSIADVAVVWAKLDGVIRGFLVEKGTPGFSTQETKNKLSFRASDTSELIFEECEIPKENILLESSGIKSPLSCLTQARFGVAWGAIGSAMVTYEVARDYAISRKQFNDKPIASHQLVQAKLTRMLTEITQAQWLSYRVTQLKAMGQATPSQISMMKMNNTEMALRTARSARSILGGSGITGEYPVMRHMCNLETTVTYEGTTDIHKLIIGKEITGIPAFV